jgi:hypothetical protein
MQEKIYRSSPWKKVRVGISTIMLGLGLAFIDLFTSHILESGNSIFHIGGILSLGPISILLIGVGLLSIFSGILGFPVVTLTDDGIKIRRVIGNNANAKWTSLASPEYVGAMIFMKAIGAEVDSTTKKQGRMIVEVGNLRVKGEEVVKEIFVHLAEFSGRKDVSTGGTVHSSSVSSP